MLIVVAIAADSYLDSQVFTAGTQFHRYEAHLAVQLVALLILFALLCFATRNINRLLRARDQLISELRVAREREARGSAALATTLRSIGDAVIAADTEGQIHFMNPVAEERRVGE